MSSKQSHRVGHYFSFVLRRVSNQKIWLVKICSGKDLVLRRVSIKSI
jgi:hypothetical protein